MKREGKGCATNGKPRSASAAKRAIAKKKTGRHRKPTIRQLKKRVWKQFSIYVRKSAADENGIVQCVTCPARHAWNSGQIQAGHWIHGRLDFDERNVHPQCVACNYHWNTKVSVAYSIFMVKTYRVEVMEELQLLANTQGNRYSLSELKELLDKYRTLNELADSVLTAPIGDLEEEIRAEGRDPDKVAEEVRQIMRDACAPFLTPS